MKKPEMPREYIHISGYKEIRDQKIKLSELINHANELKRISQSVYIKYPCLKDICIDNDDITFCTREISGCATARLILESSKYIPNPNYIEELKQYIKDLEEYNKNNDKN